jgi:SAM-dependent methyltransferase
LAVILHEHLWTREPKWDVRLTSSRSQSPFVPFIKYARYLEFLPLDEFNEFQGASRAMHPEALTQAGLIFGQSARPSGRNVHQRLCAFEKLHPFPGGLATDLGCGQGGYTVELAKRFERVIGVDILPTNVEQAGAGTLDNVVFRCGSLEDLPLDSETLDAAFLIEGSGSRHCSRKVAFRIAASLETASDSLHFGSKRSFPSRNPSRQNRNQVLSSLAVSLLELDLAPRPDRYRENIPQPGTLSPL